MKRQKYNCIYSNSDSYHDKIVLKTLYFLKYINSKYLNCFYSLETYIIQVPILTHFIGGYPNFYWYSKYNICSIKLLTGDHKYPSRILIDYGKDKDWYLLVDYNIFPLGIRLFNVFIERYEKETGNKIDRKYYENK